MEETPQNNDTPKKEPAISVGGSSVEKSSQNTESVSPNASSVTHEQTQETRRAIEKINNEIEPPTETSGQQKKDIKKIPVLRTLKTDITEYTQDKKSSYLDILTKANKRKKVHEEVVRVPSAKIIGIVAIAILLITGVGVTIYFMFAGPKDEEIEIVRTPRSIIRADREVAIIFIEGERKEIFDQLHKQIETPQLSGNFTYMPLLAKNATDDQKRFLDLPEFIRATGTLIPQNVSSNAITPFTLGIVDTYGQNEIVLISRITDYARMFAAMLEWEKKIVNDFRLILPKNKTQDTNRATFIDIVIKNQDARIISNIEGQPILGYTIFNKQYLVIASSKVALETILERLIISPPLI